jgi:mannose-1-phosphate guanylyltransferase/phosphomannomutase
MATLSRINNNKCDLDLKLQRDKNILYIMKFGTSGLRGLSNDLIKTGAVTYTTAFGRYLLQSGKAKTGDPVLIGRDFRQSSPDIEAICEAALAELGFKTFACGTVPTPALALYGLKARAAALMITGSHIPADRNGIKFYVPDGEIDKADEAAITKLAAGILASDERPIGGTTASEDHSERCLDLFRKRNAQLLGDGAFAGLRFGVYQHSTVARDLLTTLLSDYGAHVVPLGRSEAFVPIDTEAVSGDAIVLLNQWARLHGLDAIVSADGDGDRPLIADETGRPLRGDIIGLATAKFLNAKLVVTPVTSNSGIEALGLTVTRTRVGSPFVIAGMKEAAAGRKDGVMGFEANGGVLIAHAFDVGGYRLDALPTRDSIL